MLTIRLCALATAFLLVPLAQQPDRTVAPTSGDSYQVQCEVWSASDPTLVRAIEAQTTEGAETVLRDLRAASQGADRLLRVLAPVDRGSQARFESESEKPAVTITATGGGQTQESFSGYMSEGTTVALACEAGPSDDSVTTSLLLMVSGFTEEDGEQTRPGIPPSRRTIEVSCNATSTSGELRMLQFQTSEPGMLVVFMRATSH